MEVGSCFFTQISFYELAVLTQVVRGEFWEYNMYGKALVCFHGNCVVVSNNPEQVGSGTSGNSVCV